MLESEPGFKKIGSGEDDTYMAHEQRGKKDMRPLPHCCNKTGLWNHATAVPKLLHIEVLEAILLLLC